MMSAETEEMINTLDKLVETVEKNSVPLSSGKRVRAVVCSTQTLPFLLRFLGRVAKDLDLKLSNPSNIEQQLLVKLDDIGFLLQLIADYSDDLYRLTVLLTDLSNIEELHIIPIDDLVLILSKVVEVNRDFFTDRVLPVFLRAVKADQ